MQKIYEKLKIDQIKENTENPKLHDNEMIEQSIARNGYVFNVYVDENNVLIAGHGRLGALKKQGYEEIEVIKVSGLTDEQKNELMLADNRMTELGGYDYTKLKSFDENILKNAGFGDMLDELFPVDQAAKDDDVPETPEEPIAKVGDIYQLGRHRIMCGDSTSKNDVEKLMDGQKAQMCFTDPPYNVDYTGGMGTHEKNERKGILNDKMSKEAFFLFLSDVSQRIIESVEGGVYICMSSSELDTLKLAFEKSGGHWQSFIIWVKNNFTLSRSDFQHLYEPILYGWPGNIKNHYFINDRSIPNVWEDLREIKTEYVDGHTIISFQGYKIKLEGKIEKGEVVKKKQKTDIWRYDKPVKSTEHPTMKPVALCTEAILCSSKRDQIVLDLFLGSGSTLIAAEKAGRACFGMELDPKYVDVVIKRYEDFTGDKAVKIN